MTSKLEFKIAADKLGNRALVAIVDGQEKQRIYLPDNESAVINAVDDIIEANFQKRPISAVIRHFEGKRNVDASATLLYGDSQHVGLGEDEDYRIARVKAYIDGVASMLRDNS